MEKEETKQDEPRKKPRNMTTMQMVTRSAVGVGIAGALVGGLLGAVALGLLGTQTGLGWVIGRMLPFVGEGLVAMEAGAIVSGLFGGAAAGALPGALTGALTAPAIKKTKEMERIMPIVAEKAMEKGYMIAKTHEKEAMNEMHEESTHWREMMANQKQMEQAQARDRAS